MQQETLIEVNNGAILKTCALFTDCITEINNTQCNNVIIDVVILMYNLVSRM